MSQRKFSFVEGEYYHIYNRGNGKREIFLDAEDYLRFTRLLFVANASNHFKLHFLKDPVADFERGNPMVSIGAYCLMPNHFHVLVTQKSEQGISQSMQKLATAYSMYFNNKYERTGALFEGKFKAELVSDDRYLKYLFSYIHLNPVKLIQSDWKERGILNRREAEEYCGSYKYSSLPDYLGDLRKERVVLEREAFPKYFHSATDLRKDLFSWFSNDEFKQARPV